jgi:hypothetical protein
MKRRQPSASDTGRMKTYRLNIGGKAKVCIYSYYTYMQKYYLPKRMGGMGGI